MGLVRDFEHRGREFKVAVSKTGNQYLAVIDILGVKIPPALAEVTATTEEGAFKLAQRKGEDLIDHPPPGVPPVPEED